MVVVTIVISFFSIAFGEMVPKRIAMQQPEAWARMALGVMHGISVVFAPMMALLNVTTNGTLHLLGLKTEAEEAAASEEDIRLMVENSGEQGAIAQEEQKWIENVFDFGDRVASDVMTPEPDVSAFSLDEESDVILETIQKTGLSRYPVYEDNINDVRGVLNARDFLLNLQRQNPCPLESLLRPAYFVPENVHADRLFRDMQAQKHHLAIVVDEYGGTAGIVTIEDLLEEIVGNIYDEFDPEEPMPIQQISDGVWRVEGACGWRNWPTCWTSTCGRCRLRYRQRHGHELPALHPEDGAQFTVETNGLRIRVENVQDRKVDSALVEKLQPEPAAEDERDEGDKAEPRRTARTKRKRTKRKRKKTDLQRPAASAAAGAVRGRRKPRMQQLTLRQRLLVASMLFGMFFGAGNLIFPASMGQLAGRSIWQASAGFLITGVGLPLLGVAALGISREGGPAAAQQPGGPGLRAVFYLCAVPDHRAVLCHSPLRHGLLYRGHPAPDPGRTAAAGAGGLLAAFLRRCCSSRCGRGRS